MTRAARSRYTLLVPTYNRPVLLRSLLGYLSARGFQYPIHILDSSSGQALSENREAVRGVALDITYQVYDPAILVTDKFALGAQSVDTPYCSFCADDDVLFTEHLEELLDFLDANPAFAVAHGYYVGFKPGADFDLSSTEYSAPSIAGDDALKRIVEQVGNYQAIFYGIHRTSTMQSLLTSLSQVKSFWAKEMLTSSLALIAGGAYRTPKYFLARNTGPSIATEGWHPYHFFAGEPADLFREYAAYRAIVLQQLAMDDRCRARYQPEQMQRTFDLVYLKYLTPMLSPAVMDYFIAQSMRPDAVPRQVIEGVWKMLAPPSDGGAGGVRRYLTRIGRLTPSGAANVVRYLHRYADIYAQLRFREKIDVSLSPLPDRMAVTRKARDGRSRRYNLSYALLRQDFADGAHLNATHLRTIISHLDDYV